MFSEAEAISSAEVAKLPSRPARLQHGPALVRHALERFVERFGAEPDSAEEFFAVLARTRRLGRNPENGAIAVLAFTAAALVAILQDPPA